MIISRTPFRLSFFGGGTDYPEWHREHGGSVLATTIDKYCYLTCRYLPPFFEHRIRVVYSKIENCQTVDEVAHPSVRAVLSFLEIDRGVEVHHDGDLPARSGMGSSSAFTVGLLHSLHALQGRMPSRRQLATESIRIEQEILRETVGCQDQVVAAYGGFNHVVFEKGGGFLVRPVTVPAARIEELSARLLLFYTGIARSSSVVADSWVPDIAGRARQLEAMGRLVDEGLSVVTTGAGLDEFGRLLDEAWRLKRSLGLGVTTPELDRLYEDARAAGALGGKLTGAGGGGFLLLYAPLERQAGVRQALRRLLHVPFRFESSGTQIIFFDPEQDYAALESARPRPEPT